MRIVKPVFYIRSNGRVTPHPIMAIALYNQPEPTYIRQQTYTAAVLHTLQSLLNML
jgi:hypothetical protein